MSILLLFVVGALLLCRVEVAAGQEELAQMADLCAFSLRRTLENNESEVWDIIARDAEPDTEESGPQPVIVDYRSDELPICTVGA